MSHEVVVQNLYPSIASRSVNAMLVFLLWIRRRAKGLAGEAEGVFGTRSRRMVVVMMLLLLCNAVLLLGLGVVL